jgi:hypothetical protein
MPFNAFVNFEGISDGDSRAEIDPSSTDTLFFEQTLHRNGQQGPTGDLSVVGEVSTAGSRGPDVVEFDFMAPDGSTEGSSRLFVGNLSFDQTSDSSFSPDGRQLVVTIKGGPDAGGGDGQLDLVVANQREVSFPGFQGGVTVAVGDINHQLLPAIQPAREAAVIVEGQQNLVFFLGGVADVPSNNLKQFGIGMHNYERASELGEFVFGTELPAVQQGEYLLTAVQHAASQIQDGTSNTVLLSEGLLLP